MQLCQWAGRQVALPIKGTQGSKGQWSRPRGRRIREVFLEEVAGNGGWRGERRRQNSPGGRGGRVKTRR